MRRLAGLLSLTAAGMSALIWLKPWLSGYWLLVWPSRMLACALAPLLSIAGAAGALLGLVYRRPLSTAVGLAGAVLSARYVAQVISPHDGFEAVLGPDWEDRIPPALKSHLAPRRWPYVMPAETPPAHWQRNVAYGINSDTGMPLRADLWEPLPGTPRTGLAVIYAHGGAWRINDKDRGTRAFFKRLVGQGHVVMDIAYSMAPAVQMRSMVADIKRAILWLKANAAAYQLDPARIVLAGGSAGGHLSLLAAYTPNDPAFQPEGEDGDTSVCGVISFYGPTDFRAVDRDMQRAVRELTEWPLPVYGTLLRWMLRGSGLMNAGDSLDAGIGFVSNLLGEAGDGTDDPYSRFSPIDHAGPHCPPTLQLQGAGDFFGMAQPVRQLHRKLRAAGVPSILVEFPHTDHAFDLILPQVSPSAQAALYDVERFLALLSDGTQLGRQGD